MYICVYICILCVYMCVYMCVLCVYCVYIGAILREKNRIESGLVDVSLRGIQLRKTAWRWTRAALGLQDNSCAENTVRGLGLFVFLLLVWRAHQIITDDQMITGKPNDQTIRQ